jgi:hypothetical protein
VTRKTVIFEGLRSWLVSLSEGRDGYVSQSRISVTYTRSSNLPNDMPISSSAIQGMDLLVFLIVKNSAPPLETTQQITSMSANENTYVFLPPLFRYYPFTPPRPFLSAAQMMAPLLCISFGRYIFPAFHCYIHITKLHPHNFRIMWNAFMAQPK